MDYSTDLGPIEVGGSVPLVNVFLVDDDRVYTFSEGENSMNIFESTIRKLLEICPSREV